MKNFRPLLKYIFAAGVLTVLFAHPPTAIASQENIIDAIQKRYDATRTFSANFVQKSFLKVMGQSQEAHGKVMIKKPGKMKWDYSAPDPQTLVSNGDALWLFLPEENQATHMQIRDIYSSNTPALFLAGKGKLSESFNIGQVMDKGATLHVSLFPKESTHNIDHLILAVDKKNYQILGSSVYDKLGNKTEMHFSNIKINPEFSEDLFRFEVPKGVEVIDYTQTSTGPSSK